MITIEQIPNVLGHTVYDTSHRKIGTAEHVYLDTQTGQPEWLTVRTGMFGTKETFVPLIPAEMRGDEVIVPFEKDQIKNAPTIDIEIGEDLPQSEEARIYDYYGMQYSPAAGTAGTYATAPTADAPTTTTTAATTGTAPTTATTRATDDAMTRSEEQLRVGKESVETGRVRLRKYVTVEEQQRTVPVRREQVRVEREPITEANVDRAMSGPEISEAEAEVILHEERPVVATETVPVERVRLQKETVTEEEAVAGQVRKEHIETEGLTRDEQ